MNVCIEPTLANFAKIRQYNSYYVDKTGFLEQFLLPVPPKVSLFTRPRRFGKSLMLSMMAEFFDITKDSAGLFEGLAILRNKALCRQWQNQYPVISLTFKDITNSTYEEACANLQGVIAWQLNSFRFHRCLLTSPMVAPGTRKTLEALAESRADSAQLQKSLLTLCNTLYDHYQKPVILLIDEYDVPVITAQIHHFYDNMIGFLRIFLSKALKDNPSLAFAVVTGCLPVTSKSSMAGISNRKCYGIAETRHADAFGFTEEEVAAMLETFAMKDKMAEVREWYGGYRFGNRENIFCPWVITNYVQDHIYSPDMAPAAYWLDTSGNEVLSDLLAQSDDRFEKALETLCDGRCLVVRLDEQLSSPSPAPDSAQFWTLLYLTGYLTRASEEQMRRCNVVLKEGETALVIPDREVRQGFTQSLMLWFSEHMQAVSHTQLYAHFWDMEPECLEQVLENAMQHMLSSFAHHEYVYLSMLCFLFEHSYTVRADRESASGRYALVVYDEKHRRAAVITLKRAKTRDQALLPLAEKALQQCADIQSATDLCADHTDTTILHYGMALYKRTCRIVVQPIRLQP